MDWVMGKKKGYPKNEMGLNATMIYIYTYVLYLYKYIVLYIYIFCIYIYMLYMLYICYIYIYVIYIYVILYILCYVYIYMLYVYWICIIYICIYMASHPWFFGPECNDFWMYCLVSDEKTHPTILGHNNQLVKSPPMVWSWHEAGQVPQGVDVLAAARGPGGVNLDYPWT